MSCVLVLSRGGGVCEQVSSLVQRFAATSQRLASADGLGPIAPRRRASVFAARVRSRLGGRGVYLGAVPRPALAPLLPAAAGVGGGGLLGRRAPRSSARPGLCSSRLSLAFFGGPRARIAAARASSVYESAIIRLRTPIHAMVASVQLLSMRSRSATIVWVLGAGPVSDAVPRSRTARRTALQT